MIFTLSDLRATAERRLPGYLDAVLSIATPLGDDRYELTSEQIASLAKYRRPLGLGDAGKSAIHAVVDVTPLAQEIKTKIKRCGGCAKRAARLNKILPDINPFKGA